MRYQNKFVILGSILLCVLAVWIYSQFNPEQYAFFPKCPFLQLTGWECPGCGSQRAIHDLLHGEIVSAFCHNALLVISIPFVILLLVAQGLADKYPTFHNSLNSTRVIWACFVVIMAWWVCRNIY